MFNSKQSLTSKIPNKFLLSADRQSPVFYRINIEYFTLYHGVKPEMVKESILRGLTNNLTNINADPLSKATLWKTAHEQVLEKLTLKVSLEMKRQLKHLPIAALKRFPPDIKSAQQILVKTPTDHLCHFHLAWLYGIAKNYALAERHFNVAALQSQSINPQFSCFAYRHLANIRFMTGKYSQALLSIETACQLNQGYDPELQFERVRLLSRAQRTTQALSHLVALITKSPHYEIFALQDSHLLENPSLNRFIQQEKEKHISNIQRQLLEHWKNDPLHLLDLDKELEQQQSIKTLQSKQRDMLLKLSPLMMFNEELSCQLIQERSRSIIIGSLNERKQEYIKTIEGHQECADKFHDSGQWMLYASVVILIALGLSYAVSTIAYQFNFHWPINLHIQSIVLGCVGGLLVLGTALLHFTPRKLPDLLRQRQKLEELSMRLGVSTG